MEIYEINHILELKDKVLLKYNIFFFFSCLSLSGGLIPVESRLERFSYDLEMKTRENGNNKRTEIEWFDWFIERIQTRVAFGWLSERSRKKTSCPRTF